MVEDLSFGHSDRPTGLEPLGHGQLGERTLNGADTAAAWVATNAVVDTGAELSQQAWGDVATQEVVLSEPGLPPEPSSEVPADSEREAEPEAPAQVGGDANEPPETPGGGETAGEGDMSDPEHTLVLPDSLKTLRAGAMELINHAGEFDAVGPYDNPLARTYKFPGDLVVAAGFEEGTTVEVGDLPPHALSEDGELDPHRLSFRIEREDEVITSERVLDADLEEDGSLTPLTPHHLVTTTEHMSLGDLSDQEVYERLMASAEESAADMFSQAECDQLQWLVDETRRASGLAQDQ